MIDRIEARFGIIPKRPIVSILMRHSWLPVDGRKVLKADLLLLAIPEKIRLLNELVVDVGHRWLKSPGFYAALWQVNPQLITMLCVTLSYQSNIMAE